LSGAGIAINADGKWREPLQKTHFLRLISVPKRTVAVESQSGSASAQKQKEGGYSWIKLRPKEAHKSVKNQWRRGVNDE